MGLDGAAAARVPLEVLEEAACLFEVIGDEARLLDANAGWQALFPLGDDIAHPRPEDVLPAEPEVVRERFAEAIGGRGRVKLSSVRSGDAGVKLYEWTIVPIVEGSRCTHVLVVARDVTELIEAEQRFHESERHLAEAEQLVHLGSWSWDIPRNAISWSEELYRIYGVTPQEVPATYEAFIERLHPDDRQMVDEAVQRSLTTGSELAFDHRIVRPDGTIRWLRGRGEVVKDANGRSVRMFGTAQDVTDLLRAGEAALRGEEKLRMLVESAADAVVGVGADGTILLVNEQTEMLFGYTRSEMLGRPVEMLLPERVRDVHVSHRAAYLGDPRTRPMGTGLDLAGRRKDGGEFPVDISLSAIETDAGLMVTAFIRNIADRRKAEEAARALREAEQARRQALEINDGVVQGLATAVWALEAGAQREALAAMRRTLATAREMMGDLLAGPHGARAQFAPGELVRARPATVLTTEALRAIVPPKAPLAQAPIRVVIADDTPDIRLVLRFALDPRQGFEVVGEASDGKEAVGIVEATHPDVVLLDLAMPVMDGLQAIPLIRRASPETKIAVLSGYGADQIAAKALEAGADDYVEKGGAAKKVAAKLRELCPGKGTTGAQAPVEMEEIEPVQDETELLLSGYLHELRTPATVLQGIVDTLAQRIDVLPSPVVREFLESMHRNVLHLTSLIDAFSDARKIGAEALSIAPEPADVGVLVRSTVDDLADLLKEIPVNVTVEPGLVAPIDHLRIRQVLVNLLSNAAKFSPPGAPIEVDAHALESFAVVSVTDHGPGVPPERQGELFGRFKRLQGDKPGAGLGLYISRGIARAHGGNLVLGRSDGKRTTFVLVLPLSAATRQMGHTGQATSNG